MSTEFDRSWLKTLIPGVPRVLMDVGTWDAADAIELKVQCPDSRVIAFEACPDNYQWLLEQGETKRRGVELFHYAVGDVDGVVDFHSNLDGNMPEGRFGMSGSVLAPTERLKRDCPNLFFGVPRTVPAIRLDTFCRQQKIGLLDIDLLHMDVQGAEAFVLNGLGDVRPRLVFLEVNEQSEAGHYQGGVSGRILLGFLRLMGYRQYWTNGQNSLFTRVESQSTAAPPTVSLSPGSCSRASADFGGKAAVRSAPGPETPPHGTCKTNAGGNSSGARLLPSQSRTI